MTNQEREEFELVAKACGYEIYTASDQWVAPCFAYTNDEWNPKTDDGDALRLLNHFPLILDVSTPMKRVGKVHADGWLERWLSHVDSEAEKISEDAATRLAIWRAAVAYARSLY